MNLENAQPFTNNTTNTTTEKIIKSHPPQQQQNPNLQSAGTPRLANINNLTPSKRLLGTPRFTKASSPSGLTITPKYSPPSATKKHKKFIPSGRIKVPRGGGA